jgi:preprotein translocase subunit SecA
MTSGFMGAATRLAARVFGTKHEKDIKRLRPLVAEINEHYETLAPLSDDDLRARTTTWQAEFQAIWNDPDAEQSVKEELVRDHMDEILPEAFAVVKEACRRHVGKSWPVVGIEVGWDMVPFDVQLIGGIVLHEGKIAEMATGEGKTLVALMPMYLNALPGKGCHLVTVNDYLARRDSEWVGRILQFLGLSVGCIEHFLSPEQRRDQYGRDVTYGTNNEFGFDYLRDNMAVRIDDRVQRGFWYAIVDEVDSVLIDEARTPLIISGPVAHSVQHYDSLKTAIERIVRRQTQTTNTLLAEAERMVQEGVKGDKEWELGVKLLQVRRGAPKNKRLMKLLADDPGLNRNIQKTELEFIRDKKMNELDAELCYAIDEKSHSIDITDLGRETIAPNDPDMFVLPDLSTELAELDKSELDPIEKAKAKDKTYRDYAERADRIHTALQMLKAYSLYEKDVEYVVQEGKILIVDEFTGRLMPGRRYSDGLHQAIEAKEGVRVEGETQTLATITLQNFFRMYRKLAGMTGTAETEAGEFFSIYKLDTVVIPTHRPTARVDFEDVIFRTRREKYNAIIDEIVELNKVSIPVLVGTVSVEVSETLSRLLGRRGVKHSVLNAKHHQREAEIVSLAGQAGAVTIATNMAGRGTDIKLGQGVLVPAPGTPVPETDGKGKITDQNQVRGLAIIGTERHESRRIDRQLRGRSGRQGDPGSSRFFLSLEDDLMRLFGVERISVVMEKLGLEEGEVIEHPWVTKAVERAQKRVEAHNFSIRKHLLEYDDVMNKQREVIYDQRLRVLEGENLKETMLGYLDDYVVTMAENTLATDLPPEEWDLKALAAELELNLLNPFPVAGIEGDHLDAAHVVDYFQKLAREAYDRKEAELTEPIMREVERRVALSIIDEQWRDHLHEIDLIKEGIGLRAWGQKDPLLEYKKEAFNTFAEMNERIKHETVKRLYRVSLVPQVAAAPEPPRRPVMASATTSHSGFSAFSAPTPAGLSGPAGVESGGPSGTSGEMFPRREGAPRAQSPAEPVRVAEKVGRNDPCPCGSGKKYKKCHGTAT